MAVDVHVPEWVVPARRAVEDDVAVCRAAGPSPRADEVLAALDSAASCTSATAAIAASARHPLAGADTLLWLAGMISIPPVQIPRRRADGEIVTVDELLAEAAAEPGWRYLLPEQRAERRSKFAQQVARWRRLDALIASAMSQPAS